MSTIGRKKLNLNTVSVNLGCSCTRPKLSLLFHPKPKLKTTTKPHKRHQRTNYSSSSSWTNDDDEASTTTTTTRSTRTTATTTTSLSSSSSTPNDNVSSKAATKKKKTMKKSASPARGFGRVGGEGVAVEKDSDDPYLDFRHSMLQMILENEIYSKDDLRELLNCFLQLNAPSHHAIIVRAFAEIWEGVFRSSLQPNHRKTHYGHFTNDTVQPDAQYGNFANDNLHASTHFGNYSNDSVHVHATTHYGNYSNDNVHATTHYGNYSNYDTTSRDYCYYY